MSLSFGRGGPGTLPLPSFERRGLEAGPCRDPESPRGVGKVQMGIPDPRSPRGVVLADEARRSRHRLYPVTAAYTSFSLLVLVSALRSHAAAAVFMAALGLSVWTYVEYLAHRYILHGRFPCGTTWWSRFLNRSFDHLHWQHHQRPWDGNHINGTISDTLWAVAPVGLLGFLAPVHTFPAFFAGFLLGYVIEEWCHHSVHYYVLAWPWFRRLKARHFYHHSRAGAEILFGLSNGFWDDVLGTGPPELRWPKGPGDRAQGLTTGVERSKRGECTCHRKL